MNYIVLDLEWNQGNEEKEKQRKDIPFEIIEIGAIKLDARMEFGGSFHEVVKPQVYQEMHRMTRQLLHMDMEQLQEGDLFPDVCKRFLSWCGTPAQGDDAGKHVRDGAPGPESTEKAGETYAGGGIAVAAVPWLFATWGPQDLTELQRNMRFYGMGPLAGGPVKFYDIQKLFSIAFEDKKIRRNLEYAVDFLKIQKDGAFHRALSDAYYAARVLQQIRDPQVLQKVSFDTFQLPQSRKDEVRIVFDDYAKYISRRFDDKAQLLTDREVASTKCYICRRNLKRKIKWFTPNGKHYYSLSFCGQHGYMKGKIRIRRAEDDGVYAVKTTKFISEEEADELFRRRDAAKGQKGLNRKKKEV